MAAGAVPRRRHHHARPDEARRHAARSAWSTSTASTPTYGRIEGGADGPASRRPRRRWPRRRDHPEIRRDYPVIAQIAGARGQPADPQHGDPRRQRAAAHPLHLLPRSELGRLQQARAGLAAAPRWTASTASTRCSASATSASPPIPATSPRRWSRSSAAVEIVGPGGARAHPVRGAAPRPGDTPHVETVLQPGELITGFRVPAGAVDPALALSEGPRPRNPTSSRWPPPRSRSTSTDGVVREARIGARRRRHKPWRAHEAEAALRASGSTRQRASAPADAAFAGARTARRQRLQDRARPAHAGRAPCCKPPRWRSEHGPDADAPLQPRPASAPPTPRIDGRLKVTGAARYASDMPRRRPGLCLSRAPAPSPAAASPRIDDSAARAVPGVLDILTHRNVGDAIKPGKLFSDGGYMGIDHRAAGLRPDLARRPDRRRGGRRQLRGGARGGAPAARSTTPRSSPRPSFDSAGVDDAVAAKDGAERATRTPQVGDADAAPSPAPPVKVDAALRDADPAPQPDRAVHHHLRLGRRQADGLGSRARTSTASSTASPSSSASTRPTSASISPFVGGAFGSRGSLTQRTALVALAAQRLGRPVQAGGHARPGLHHRHLPRRDAPPRPARRRPRRQAAGADPRGLGGHLAGPTTTRSPAPTPSTRLYACPNVASKVSHRPRRPQHAGLHALAARDALSVRAGDRRWTSWPSRSTWTRSSCAGVNDTEHEPIKGLPYTIARADAVLRRGGQGVRLGAARPAAGLDARRRLAGRLGLRHHHLPDPDGRRRPRA